MARLAAELLRHKQTREQIVKHAIAFLHDYRHEQDYYQVLGIRFRQVNASFVRNSSGPWYRVTAGPIADWPEDLYTGRDVG